MPTLKRFIALLSLLAVLAFISPPPAGATLLLSNEGEVQMLSTILGTASTENLTLKLFVSNTTPAEADTANTYTEAAGGGYSAITLTRGAGWTITAGAPTQAAYGQQSFTFTGALTTNTTVYGYYVVGATSGKLYWSERLTQPFTPANNGDVLRITPKFTLE